MTTPSQKSYQGGRIAIVGSRGWVDLGLVRAYVRALPAVPTLIVSGGARGVDRTAEDEAFRRGFDRSVWFADWRRHGSMAGLRRNHSIVADCTRLVAFWDGRSPGTAHSLELARDAGKPIEVYIEGVAGNSADDANVWAKVTEIRQSRKG